MSDSSRPMKVLFDLRPALGKHAGIPQDCRLLFSGLHQTPGLAMEGLLQTSLRRLTSGARRHARTGAASVDGSVAVELSSRVVAALGDVAAGSGSSRSWTVAVSEWRRALGLAWRAATGAGRIRTWSLDARGFEDFFWQALFARTLAPHERAVLADARFRVCDDPWRTLHRAGQRQGWFKPGRHGTLDTGDAEVFVAHTPYPARVSARTALVVRYYDAVPVWMPHTINDPARHQAWHLAALRANARAGAWFVCPSETVRSQLLRMYPRLEPRARVLPCMVAPHFRAAESAAEQIPGIVRAHLDGAARSVQPAFSHWRERQRFYDRHLGGRPWRYALVVSTLEPRKNHACVLAAWEHLRATSVAVPKLLFVGEAGWRQEALHPRLQALGERGELFVMNAVPGWALRTLYRHAVVTICPSFGEGFDLSGVEAMASGGTVAASDIPVHREVYGDGATFFDPHDPGALAHHVQQLISAGDNEDRPTSLRAAGLRQARRYSPELVVPRWHQLLQEVADQHRQQQA